LRTTALRLALDSRARRGREPLIGALEEEPGGRGRRVRAMNKRTSIGCLLGSTWSNRDVLVRFHRHGHSIDEISTALHLPSGTVKSHLHRARRKLAAGPRGGDRG